MIGYQTKIWHVEKAVENNQLCPQLQEAAQLLKKGEAVAFPTETVYGLGANALSSTAVEKIFQAKGRPSDNPLIVHIANQEELQRLTTRIPAKAQQLMDAFWPGPLTLILPKGEGIAPEVTAGLDSVGVRMPDHPVALALLREAGVPIAAPSANRSGRPSPTTADHVEEDLQGKISGIVDGGATGVGVESTVLDVTQDPPMILRPGGLTKEAIEQVIGPIEVDAHLTLPQDQQPRSPGMKYQHYAPKGEMWIVESEHVEEQVRIIHKWIGQAHKNQRKVGVLATEETKALYPEADYVAVCGSREDLTSVARNLYDSLRSFDHKEVDFILSESFSVSGVGSAVMNRLGKAAGHRILTS